MAHGLRASLLIVAVAAGVRAAPPTPLPTLEGGRPHDPVVLATSTLAGVTDRDPAMHRLYAARGRRLEPVPFQVDRRDARGRYALDEATVGPGPPFDDDDELVFMAKDTGHPVAPGCLPGGGAAHEIAVRDPATGAEGFAYLVHDPSGPRPAEPPYTVFDTARSELRARAYHLYYPPGRNFFTRLRVARPGGDPGGALIERMSMRINPTFSLLIGDWSPELTEESFRTEIDGVRNGPVRSIVRARQSLDLGRVLPDPPAGTMHTFYYASYFTTPSTFVIPDIALKLLRDFRYEGTSVLGGAGPETRYFDANHPAGVGFTTTPAAVAAERDHDWYVVDGPSGAYAHTLVIPDRWREWGIARGTVLRHDDAGRPAAGYSLRNLTRLQAGGAYDLLVSFVVLGRRYRPGDEAAALAMARRPLVVDVRPLPSGRGSDRPADCPMVSDPAAAESSAGSRIAW